MSSDSIYFGPHNTNKNFSNCIQVAPENNSDSSYHTWKCAENPTFKVNIHITATSNFKKQEHNKCKKHNYKNKFGNSKTSKYMFPTGTLLFHISQMIRSVKDISVSIESIKCFLGMLGERYSFKKKPEIPHDSTPPSE